MNNHNRIMETGFMVIEDKLNLNRIMPIAIAIGNADNYN